MSSALLNIHVCTPCSRSETAWHIIAWFHCCSPEEAVVLASINHTQNPLSWYASLWAAYPAELQASSRVWGCKNFDLSKHATALTDDQPLKITSLTCL